MTIPTTEPTQITAGDYVTWQMSMSDYPATLFTLSYMLVGASRVVTVTSAASGTDHLIVIEGDSDAGPPVVVGTDVYEAGLYSLIPYVTEIATGRRTSFTSKSLNVLADPTAAAAADQRSWASVALDAIKVILQDPAKIAQKTATIGDRTITWRDTKELMSLYSFYEQAVASQTNTENIANGVNSGGRFLMRL